MRVRIAPFLCLLFVLGFAGQAAADGIEQRLAAVERQLTNALAQIAALQTALNNEVALRQAAEAALQTNINNEAAARAAADVTLHGNIDAGGASRLAADAALQANIDAEAAARAAADITLQGNIDAEATARAAADVTLQDNIDAEAAARIAADQALQDQISAIEAGSVPQVLLDIAPYLTFDTNTVNGLAGPHVIFTGVNVHLRDGLGPTSIESWFNASTNGLGNLIMGYNEATVDAGPLERVGSHNLIVGPFHQYTNRGGVVAGFRNAVTAPAATVSGGSFNAASGITASVNGGASNTASGTGSTVSGGSGHTASVDYELKP